MGTSTNYNAPTSPQWKKLKGKVTRLTRPGVPSLTSIKEILQDFVNVNYVTSRDSSGSRGTAHRRDVQDVARNIGRFFASAAEVGFRQAFEDAELGSLEGKSLSEIVYLLLDHLGGPSSTLDDTDIQTALCDLVAEIFNGADSLEEFEEAIQTKSSGEFLENLIISFFGYYVYQQFCRVFYEQLIANIGERQADESINGIREYICLKVKDVVSDRDVKQIDWNGSQGQQIVEEILQRTLEVFSA